VPPRFAFWTILIDDKPTAFRAQHREELLPTLHQLKRTNHNVVMKWFSRGRLWESRDEALQAGRRPKPIEKRSRDWRPGGQHRDPRARWTQTKKRPEGRERRPWGARRAVNARPKKRRGPPDQE